MSVLSWLDDLIQAQRNRPRYAISRAVAGSTNISIMVIFDIIIIYQQAEPKTQTSGPDKLARIACRLHHILWLGQPQQHD
jgi:hypothetical protein